VEALVALVAVWKGLLRARGGPGWRGSPRAGWIGVIHAAHHAPPSSATFSPAPGWRFLIRATLALGWMNAPDCMSMVSAAPQR